MINCQRISARNNIILNNITKESHFTMKFSLTYIVVAFAALTNAFTYEEMVKRELGEGFSFGDLAKRQGTFSCKMLSAGLRHFELINLVCRLHRMHRKWCD
jgi:hypothetical protein